MKLSDAKEMAKQFAVKIIATFNQITAAGYFVLIDKIVKSSSSIGANIHTANYASSKLDYISKLQMALQDCCETEYWIEMLQATQTIGEDIAKAWTNDCSEIMRMLVKFINTAKVSV